MKEVLAKNENYMLSGGNPNNIHISFSEFSLFNQCGHRHLIEKYLEIEKQPPSIHLFYGNAIHESIESTFKNNLSLDDRITHFKATFKKYMMDNMLTSPDFKDLNAFTEQGENTLRILDLDSLKDEYEIYSVEEPIYEPLYGKFFFKGFIDLCLKHKKKFKFIIVDWKTSGQKWNKEKKFKDIFFMCQPRFYKYFWARKNNVPLEDVECRYIVLNRLTDSKKPEKGFGEIDPIDITSTEEDIKNALSMLAKTIKSIHVDSYFPKVKHYGEERSGCIFCPYKGGKHILCDSSFTQAEKLIKQYKK